MGVALVAAGLLGPLDHLAKTLLTAHMAQHLLIADLAAPFLLAGARTPVLYFIPPKSLLVKLARRHRLRAAFRFVRRPLVALPLFVVILYTWHFAFAFQAALRHGWVHALQHESFLLGALPVWWPAIEPMRRPMPGALWKGGYIFASAPINVEGLRPMFDTSAKPSSTGTFGSGNRSYYSNETLGNTVYEADGGERGRRPDQGQAGETSAPAIREEAEERLRDRRHPAVGKRDQADGLQVEAEAMDEQREEHREQADVAVDGEVPEHQRDEPAVAKTGQYQSAFAQSFGGKCAGIGRR